MLFKSKALHTYINDQYNHSLRLRPILLIIPIHAVCVLFYARVAGLTVKVYNELQFEKLVISILFSLRVFARKLKRFQAYDSRQTVHKSYRWQL